VAGGADAAGTRRFVGSNATARAALLLR